MQLVALVREMQPSRDNSAARVVVGCPAARAAAGDLELGGLVYAGDPYALHVRMGRCLLFVTYDDVFSDVDPYANGGPAFIDRRVFRVRAIQVFIHPIGPSLNRDIQGLDSRHERLIAFYTVSSEILDPWRAR